MGLPKQEGYRQAVEIACNRLKSVDLPKQAENGGFSLSYRSRIL